MISARETREYVPYGRVIGSDHPRKPPVSGRAADSEHGFPIVKALNDISLRDVKHDWWQLRRSKGEKEGSDEELYINEQLVVWSKGSPEGAGQVIKTFTMDSTVQQALWCTFLLPIDQQVGDTTSESGPGEHHQASLTVPAKVQSGVCVIENSGSVSVFTTEGRDYVTALPFQVKKTWSIKNGLLFERAVTHQIHTDVTKTPNKTPRKDQPNLPVLFSMLHPLDEVAPVICRTGGSSSSAKVSFVTEQSQQIVYTSADPSLALTYDRILSAHAVWTLRRAKPEEAYMACGTTLGAGDTCPSMGAGAFSQDLGTTPGLSHSASGLSRLTLSSQSPSAGSPFRSYPGSRVSSPAGPPGSRLNSPSISRLAALSRSQSPSLAMERLLRYGSPSPHGKSPSGGMARTPISANVSYGDSMAAPEAVEPLAPEVCMDHLWTETGISTRDGAIGCASKVFLAKDLCGQHFLCYLVTFRHQLRCVKFGESNDRSKLIFGSLSIIQSRDAVALQGLNMIVVLDMNNSLVLYSGITMMTKIFVGGLPMPLNVPSTSHHHQGGPALSSPFGSPPRISGGPITSSRPPSAMDSRFDEEGPLLSPVPTEFNDSSQLFETSLTGDLSFQPNVSWASGGMVCGIRDPVWDRFTLELTDDTLYRTSLPPLTTSPMINACLAAVKMILPKDVAIQVLIRWYSTHNSPGSVNGQSDWVQFIRCLLGLMGYDVENLPLTKKWDVDGSLSPVVAPKKAKPSDQGSVNDWDYLLGSDHHKLVSRSHGNRLGLEPVATVMEREESSQSSLDMTAILFPHIPALLFALQLVYEELKLDAPFLGELHQLGALLFQLARDLRCPLYADHYCRDQPGIFSMIQDHTQVTDEHLRHMNQPTFFTASPPSIYHWLQAFLRGGAQVNPYPFLPGVSNKTIHVIAMYVALLVPETVKEITWSTYLRKVSIAGHRTPDIEHIILRGFEGCMTGNQCERVVLYMAKLGGKMTIAPGPLLPLLETLFHCRDNPSGSWPKEAFTLIGREDLAQQLSPPKMKSPPTATPSRESTTAATKGMKEEDDGMEYLDKELLKLRFSEDLRVQEVRRLLQSARPVRVAIQQRPEVSDHEFIEEQEKHLYATCIRTMALPLGRGMLTLCTYHPVPTETLPIPKLCLTGRAPPRNTTVDLTHIDTPPNMSHWPQFHNGVAAGLRIADSSQLDTAWILYNKPSSNELTNQHAGFLMGLGLNGHLSSLATLNVHDYLIRGHEMTSVALILGISAGMRGSMDMNTVKLLSIHLTALLPPTSTELDVAHNIQVAAVLGVGLVYQGTAHRHIAEVLLSEIGRPPGPEMENCTDRESYSLAAGLALGLVMLGKGGDVLGLSDLGMADQLYHYMVGGQKRPLTGAHKERYKSSSYQIKEGDAVNIDVTAPGATLALGMMFFNSKNSAVADWLTAPDTQFLLDFVRPDFLMLRIIARGLVLWDYIHPSEDWINQNLPEIVSKYAFNKMKFQDDPDCDTDFETMSQAYCNIVAGACMAVGLRFAGSANQDAFNCLYEMIKKILKLMSKPVLVEQAGKSTVENALAVLVLSLAMVMAGTGNLEVLRLCRHLRSRVGVTYAYVLYGSHMAISMSLGLLFMGGGRYTLSSKPEAVAAMLCAFFPKFPIHSNDNRYHLQAFRHLYVLAAEPRVLIPRDVDSGLACYVPLNIQFKGTEDYPAQGYTLMAPCVLPELNKIDQIEVHGPRYWPVCFKDGQNWDVLSSILKGSGNLFVKQRAGHLSYAADPEGNHSMLAQSLTSDQSLGRVIRSEDIKSFSSDPRILAFAEYFCSSGKEEEYEMIHFLSRILQECVSQEKLTILPLYTSLHQTVNMAERQCAPLDLWQLKLMMAFYERLANESSQAGRHTLISREYIVGLQNNVQKTLSAWLQGSSNAVSQYFSGQPVVCDFQLLSAYLTWYNIPHPSLLANAGLQGSPSFPALYKLLRPHGLTVKSVMALANVIQKMNNTS